MLMYMDMSGFPPLWSWVISLPNISGYQWISMGKNKFDTRLYKLMVWASELPSPSQSNHFLTEHSYMLTASIISSDGMPYIIQWSTQVSCVSNNLAHISLPIAINVLTNLVLKTIWCRESRYTSIYHTSLKGTEHALGNPLTSHFKLLNRHKLLLHWNILTGLGIFQH